MADRFRATVDKTGWSGEKNAKAGLANVTGCDCCGARFLNQQKFKTKFEVVDRGTVSTCNSSASDGAFVSYDDGSHTKLGCLVAISCHPIRRMPACGRIRAQRDAAHCVCLRSDMAGASWEGPSHLSKITHTFC